MKDIMKKCYQRNTSIISKMIDDELVLVFMRDNLVGLEDIYILNDVGNRIWELIDGKRPIETIKIMIAKEYEVTPKKLGDDLVSFIRELERTECIKGVEKCIKMKKIKIVN